MASAVERHFSVHARPIDRHHARILTETTVEAAALAYLEDFHVPSPAVEIVIVVRDVEDGHERCFRIDLDAGVRETGAGE